MGNIRYEVDPPEGDAPIWPLYISVSEYDHTWHSILHSHANAEIFYCLAGEGRFKVENEDIPVSKDDLIIVNPNIAHTEYSLEDRHLSYIVVGVKGVSFRAKNGEEVSYQALNYAQNRQDLLPYFNSLVSEADRREAHYAETCYHILQVLLIKLQRHEHFSAEYITPKKITSPDCLAVKRYIDAHYAEQLDLDSLARISHMSKFYLVHSFQKEFGISPINYLMRRRIREACQLLTHTNHLLSDVSHMLGFSSPSYFSQVFRRIMGTSPRAYRQALRASNNNGKSKNA